MKGVGEQIEVEGASDGNPFEVGDADGRPPAEGVGPQRDHARLHGAERHEPDAGALVGSVHEAEVDGFFLQGVQDGGIGHLERGDGAPRRAVDELVDERHRFVTLVEKQVIERERLERDGQRFRLPRARALRLHVQVDLVQLAQHRFGVNEDLAAVFGEAHPVVTVEQLEPHLVLERSGWPWRRPAWRRTTPRRPSPRFRNAPRPTGISTDEAPRSTSPVLACARAGAIRVPACPSPCPRWSRRRRLRARAA